MKANDQLNFIFATRWEYPALICDERNFSYCELYRFSSGIALWLSARGCSASDTVGLRLPNGWLFAAAYLACLIGGYRIVPINPEISVEDQSYIVARTQPKIVVEDELLLSEISSLDAVKPGFAYPDLGVAAIFFTSGTTGRPKGVCHSLESLVGNVVSFNKAHNLDPRTRMYHVLPMAYMAGFLNTLLSPWMAGGVVLLGPRFRPADALQFWRRPLQWQANAIWLTPTLASVLARMSRDPEIARQIGFNMKHVFCGMAPLPNATRKTFRDVFDCHLQESYGMSEVLLVSAQTRDEAARGTSTGHLLPGLSIRTRELTEVDAKELVIYSPWCLKSYLQEEGESSPLLSDGGMPTGDQGKLDNGQLVITGRIKDLIIRGGVNVSPVAVEEALLRERGVEAAAVVGMPHDIWGEIIVACLVATPGEDESILQLALQKRCEIELGDAMRPDRYVWLNSLPTASTGKVQKHILRIKLG